MFAFIAVKSAVTRTVGIKALPPWRLPWNAAMGFALTVPPKSSLNTLLTVDLNNRRPLYMRQR
jgi:hypothetical protein